MPPLYPITINGITLDPEAEVATGGDKLHASSLKHILIQSRELLTAAQKNQLFEMGLVLQQYVSENTYLYHNLGANLDEVYRLPHIVFIDVYRWEYKIGEHFGRTTDMSHEVDVMFHQDVDLNSQAIRELITKKAYINIGDVRFSRHQARLTVNGQYLDEVLGIEGVPERVLAYN